MERVGPERLADNTSPLRGPITAFAGYGTHCAYAALYNASRETASLLQFGAWLPVGAAGDLAPAGAGAALCGSVARRAVRLDRGRRQRVTALFATTHPDVVGAPEDASGNRATRCCWWATRRHSATCGCPATARVPSAATRTWTRTSYRPESSTSAAPPSLMAARDTKSYLSFSATGPVLDAYRRDEVYRVDATGATATTPRGLPGADRGPDRPGQHIPFPMTRSKIISVRGYHVADDPAGDPLEASYAAARARRWSPR